MGLRILVFDDDKPICDMLEQALTSKGHAVTTYVNPAEFPFFNEHICPCPTDDPCADILITDIVMPEIDGLDFFKQLKEAGCRPLVNGNVAIMSGHLTLHSMGEFNQLGIHCFRKPLEINEICHWVDECAHRNRSAS
ncbi:MAG: response regulator [Deltaproteobacteria bacterium]|jgi:DNA-binding NtrC family response regulator|nr:response regulator [Deltaproteobacteria bacterium]